MSNAAAGAVIAVVSGTLATIPAAPFLASVMAQASYGFTFTAYDPYAADPMVFLIAALLTWCWITDRPWPALSLAGSVAIGLNALVTAKAGSSSPWLPSARWVLLLAAIAAVFLVVRRGGL